MIIRGCLGLAVLWLVMAASAAANTPHGDHRSAAGLDDWCLQELQAELIAAAGTEREARVRARIGAALFESGDYLASADQLATALAAMRDAPAGERAAVHNDLGLALEAVSDFDGASAQFDTAIALASGSDAAQSVLARSSLNALRLDLYLGHREHFEANLDRTAQRIAAVDDPVTRADMWIGAADLARSGYWHFSLPSRLRLQAHEWLQQARDLTTDRSPYLHSMALGHLARLYEDDGRDEEALGIARQAIFHAQQAEAADSLYQWQWLVGRIDRRHGRYEAAVARFDQAVATLEPIRSSLMTRSPWNFDSRVGPLYRQYADLLLRQAAAGSGDDRAAQLLAVRRLLEQAKAAEIENYFQDDCLAPQGGIDPLGLDGSIVTFYPIMLPDRVDLLLSVGGSLHLRSTPLPEAQLRQLVIDLRRVLQNYSRLAVVQQRAASLYDALIRPAEDLLQGSDTLVIVPDGILRTIPFAVLYDGERYLVERFAVATTLGLDTTQPKQAAGTAGSVFAGGVSESRQGMSPLPGVVEELKVIEARLGADPLQDQNFTRDSFSAALGSQAPSIVHVATHGKFDADPRKSFLLAYDGLITLNDLEMALAGGSRTNNVDLLVLSACETAVGDERAALGLAGIALKAGANSALASLWSISDAATVRLIDGFYDALLEPGTSKAHALQVAQRRLIDSEQYAHPWQWAAFLLLGSWQ